jgi:glycosyltransferase involved in cell wall biosynthesis
MPSLQVCPIEFRGYVPEEAIPELFQSASILVLPYDSATGSSGPAHQACEFGVPIVCADIDDFREMAAGEDMAIRFYKKGDADDLASNSLPFCSLRSCNGRWRNTTLQRELR